MSIKFIPLINVRTPMIVGTLTFISRINTTSECFNNHYFSVLAVISCSTQLSTKKSYNLEARIH